MGSSFFRNHSKTILIVLVVMAIAIGFWVKKKPTPLPPPTSPTPPTPPTPLPPVKYPSYQELSDIWKQFPNGSDVDINNRARALLEKMTGSKASDTNPLPLSQDLIDKVEKSKEKLEQDAQPKFFNIIIAELIIFLVIYKNTPRVIEIVKQIQFNALQITENDSDHAIALWWSSSPDERMISFFSNLKTFDDRINYLENVNVTDLEEDFKIFLKALKDLPDSPDKIILLKSIIFGSDSDANAILQYILRKIQVN